MSSPVTWNPLRQLWETEQADLFSGQQEPFSETWPTSGMTRNGQLLPLPMSGHPTGGSESLLLPTPQSNSVRKGRGAMVHNRQWSAPGLEQVVEMIQGHLPREFESWDEVPGASRALLPTPVAQQSGCSPEDHLRKKPGRTQVTDLAIIVENGLM